MRGSDRQIEHATEQRRAGLSAAGGLEWLMQNNRAYMLTIVRLALLGETTSSLGLDPQRGAARASLSALQGEAPPQPRTDLDPRMVLAALLALAFGYVAGEDWIMDSLGMQACDTAQIRAGVEEVMSNIVALGGGPSGSCP